MKDHQSGSHLPSADSAQFSPLSVRVREACRLIGIGRSKFYELIAAEEIETIKVGAATLIPMACLERFIEQKRETS